MDIKVGFNIRRDQVYVWGSFMKLLPEGWKLLPMNFHGLMHMWLVGVLQQMIPPFSMFHDGRELENLPKVKMNLMRRGV